VWLSYKWLTNFKSLMFIIAVGIVISVVLYTDTIIGDLRAQSRRHLSLQVDRFRTLFMQNDATSLDMYLKEMAEKDFPVIVTDAKDNPTSWSGLPDLDSLPFPEAKERARRLQQEWVAQGNDPVPFDLPEYGLTVKY